MTDRGNEAFKRGIGRLLAALPEALETAVLAGAIVVQREAKANLRANQTWRTGNLARSIHVGGHAELSELGASSGSDIGGATTEAAMAGVDVGTDVPYARRIELGFMGTDSLGRTYHQPARPYLRPGLDQNEREIQTEVREVFLHQLRRTAGRQRP